jgi:hypothetical protein
LGPKFSSGGLSRDNFGDFIITLECIKIMKSNIHACLNPIGSAASASRYDIVFLELNMHIVSEFFNINIPKDTALKKIEYIYAHLVFFGKIFKNRRKDLIIVREFLNLPLAFSWPFFFWFRKKLLFVMNHNLQKAHTNKVDAIFLRILFKLGMRPLFLESDSGLDELGVVLLKNCYLILPIPIPKSSCKSKNDNRFTVGIIGDNRKEKKISCLAELLYEVCDRNGMTLLLGSTDQSLLDEWRGRGVTTINTLDPINYELAFSLSDAIVLNYDREAYYYRSSGVICDAIAANTVVVCPDYPILNDQITRFGRAGISFSSEEDIESILLAIKDGYDEFERGLLSQQRYRAVENISALLEKYVEAVV